MPPFYAHFDNPCPLGDRIKAGEAIEPVGDETLGWQHVQCPEATADRDDREALATPRCAVCGLNHPGEC